jgi:hypothetical protein
VRDQARLLGRGEEAVEPGRGELEVLGMGPRGAHRPLTAGLVRAALIGHSPRLLRAALIGRSPRSLRTALIGR